MITTITHPDAELQRGQCLCCYRMSNEIIIDQGRCTDCEELGKEAIELIIEKVIYENDKI